MGGAAILTEHFSQGDVLQNRQERHDDDRRAQSGGHVDEVVSGVVDLGLERRRFELGEAGLDETCQLEGLRTVQLEEVGQSRGKYHD